MSTTNSIADMLHELLTPITGKPSAKTLLLLQRELYANASEIRSQHNGARGHLGLIMPPARYHALTGEAYVSTPVPRPPRTHSWGYCSADS
jgi:hypothetical protein